MKFPKKIPGMTPGFVCAAKGNGIECTPDRARWENGFWADVCIRHHQVWASNVARLTRDPWTGRLKKQKEE